MKWQTTQFKVGSHVVQPLRGAERWVDDLAHVVHPPDTEIPTHGKLILCDVHYGRVDIRRALREVNHRDLAGMPQDCRDVVFTGDDGSLWGCLVSGELFWAGNLTPLEIARRVVEEKQCRDDMKQFMDELDNEEMIAEDPAAVHPGDVIDLEWLLGMSRLPKEIAGRVRAVLGDQER